LRSSRDTTDSCTSNRSARSRWLKPLAILTLISRRPIAANGSFDLVAIFVLKTRQSDVEYIHEAVETRVEFPIIAIRLTKPGA